jgi:hypothetical protein
MRNAVIAATALLILCGSPLGVCLISEAQAQRSNGGGNGNRAPAAPSDLSATANPQHNVLLSWSDNSENELGFRIVRERQNSNGQWRDAYGITVEANTTAFLDTPGNGNFRYRIRAYNAKGNSSYTPYAFISILATPSVPTAPSELILSDQGDGTARLVWTDLSNNEDGFEIERQPSFSTPLTRTVAANVTEYLDQVSASGGSAAGGSFAYRLRAFNAAGPSAWTSWSSINLIGTNNTPGPSTFPAIIPGSGWTGPTEQPAPVGTPGQPGYDAKAIARWDVVPFQTFDGDFNVGIVAFHMNGIAKVDFSANGGPWTSVYDMQLNPQTNVWEYTARLRASDFSQDGPVEVRAVVWPNVGEARVLAGELNPSNLKLGNHSLVLFANGSGTLPAAVRYVSPSGSNTTGDGTASNPFASIRHAALHIQSQQGNVDGGTIYLLPGDYPFAGQSSGYASPVTIERWITVSAAPGVAKEQVRIAIAGTGERLNTSLIRLHNLTVADCLVSSTNLNRPAQLWWDNCILQRDTKFQTIDPGGFSGGVYMTESLAHRLHSGPAALLLSRNNRIENILSDAFHNASFVVNARVMGIDPSGWEAAGMSGAPHPDVVQFYAASGTVENVIVYGLNAVQDITNSQGVFYGGISTARDFAIVNAVVAGNNQWNVASNHLLVWNSTFLSPFMWRAAGSLTNSAMRNISVRHNVFANSMTNDGGSSIGTAQVNNNHFSHGTLWGTAATLGNPCWYNAAAYDYRPAVNSPLRSRANTPPVPVDAAGNVIPVPNGSIGALQDTHILSGGE